MDTVGSRVIPLTDEGDLWTRHFASAEMVIEAVPENLDLKHRCVWHDHVTTALFGCARSPFWKWRKKNDGSRDMRLDSELRVRGKPFGTQTRACNLCHMPFALKSCRYL